MKFNINLILYYGEMPLTTFFFSAAGHMTISQRTEMASTTLSQDPTTHHNKMYLMTWVVEFWTMLLKVHIILLNHVAVMSKQC